MVFSCSMQSITSDGAVLRIRLREKVSKLDALVCPTFIGSGGAEGTAEMEGQPKPVVFGSPYNVSPVLLSPAYLTYMVSAGGDVSADHLKDSGSVVARALTAGVQEDDAAANFSALQGLSVPIGHYATHATSGTLKLGSPPVGQVTADARSTAGSNPADVLLAIIEHAGIAISGVYIETDPVSFAALRSWADGVGSKVGVFVRDLSTKHSDLINQITTSIALTAAKVGALPIPDPGSFYPTDTIAAALQLVGSRVRYGTGSPTGVVTAPVGTLYVDEAITTGASIWSKRTGTGNTGWVVAVGDTDWQDYTTAWAAMFTDLAGYVTFSGSPSIRARRQGALVSIQVSGLQKVNAAAATMQAGLPSGWRATYPLDYLAANSSIQIVRWYYPAGASAHVCQGPSIGGSFSLLLQFNTSDTWPATL
jgi:hypothetical protein